MHILLTNDDGYQSEGINVLAREAEKIGHKVTLIAPDSDRSGVSHGLSIHKQLEFRKLGEGRYACSGKPVDCVMSAMLHWLKEKPDLVMAGINHGPNLGTDVIYSGTAAAARHAVLMGVPGVAVSICTHQGPFFWDDGVKTLFRILPDLLTKWRSEFFWNINFPNTEKIEGIAWDVSLSPRRYMDRMTVMEEAPGLTSLKLSGELDPGSCADGSDWDSVGLGMMAITRVAVLPAWMEGDKWVR
jgi:5'-nucleotidase